jgi:hypothetical protein
MISTDYFGIFNYKRCKTSKTNTNKKTQHNYIYEILKYGTVVLFWFLPETTATYFINLVENLFPQKLQ